MMARKIRIWSYRFIFCLSMVFLAGKIDAADLNTGDSFYFGNYEQDNKQESKEFIEWEVLDIQDDKALIISRLALDYLPFDDEVVNAGWNSCSLRNWLNDDFLSESFSAEEQEAIIETTISNDSSQGNEEWEPRSVSDTEDKIFLLSYQEIMQYFETGKSRKAQDTEYASSKGNAFRQVANVAIKEAGWWTRSPGEKAGQICYVETDGKLKSKKITEKATVRPALWLDLSADSELFTYSMYQNALDLKNAGSYKEAADKFEALGALEDSIDAGIECRYLQAGEAYEKQEYEQSIDLYTNLNGYKDSDLLGRAARYEYAVQMQELENYELAIELFGEAGQYEDSMERMRKCFEKLGIPVYFFSAEAVNTGLDNGYSKENRIKGDDKHFGWRLGRFFMSGFTRINDEKRDDPIFIKTLGDSLTLWFDLEQDIYCLNENKNLSISKDKNGYDQYFNIKKTDFGQGTLLIRHTDYQNSKSDPMIYTDYVLAKGTSGADTKVIINEEGDYEVSLDYQIQDDDVLHLASKYGNYKIFFRFSVRNGNCMVYPFDVVTGAELRNTAVTEGGFYLDLARSRYLNIDVKRSVIIEGPDGNMIEDERFNRPAKDGDKYVDEGIYTISVSNQYTGESTVKTIFVGSEELLQDYIKNGFSADRLK